MNERRFLFLILTVIFLLLSIMSILVMISQVQQKMVRFLLENEKLLNTFYQGYVAGDLQERDLPPDVRSLGFYNFFKEPLYLYGDAPEILSEEMMNFPRFNRKNDSIIMERDLLNPFVPVLRSEQVIDNFHTILSDRADAYSEEQKSLMVRYVFLEIADAPINFFRRRYRFFMSLIVAGILLVVIYIGHLSLRNMRYRGQIESQQRLVMMGTAARTFTHEVKNPLSSIRLQTSIIRRSECGKHDPSLRIINEEVDRLAAMTERIGDFLRHPGGNPCRTDLTREICRVLEKREGFPCPDPGDSPRLEVMIDPERLNSIVDNLINNALESGSDPSDVTVFLERKGQEALITVGDKGEGISRKNLERILDPFFTTKSKGSGVGLSIVHAFIQAAGGSLTIHSVPGEGTDVVVKLPLLKEM